MNPKDSFVLINSLGKSLYFYYFYKQGWNIYDYIVLGFNEQLFFPKRLSLLTYSSSHTHKNLTKGEIPDIHCTSIAYGILG